MSEVGVPKTGMIDAGGYRRTVERWAKLTFPEALRELLGFYGYEEVPNGEAVNVVLYRRRTKK